MEAEEEGVDAEEEEVVAVAVFELGAGGSLMDKSIPQTQMVEVPGVAEASREVGEGGGGVDSRQYALPSALSTGTPTTSRAPMPPLPQATGAPPLLPLPGLLALPLPPVPSPIPPPFPRAPLPRLLPSSWAYPRFLLPGVGRHQIILLTLSRTSPRLLPPLPALPAPPPWALHLPLLNTTH